VVVITCLSAVTALAAEDPDKSEIRFRNLDQNQDGHISLYEARDKHRVFHYYQQADKNEDGHLDRVEFSAFEVEVPDYETK
jgi:Ca2+-binding EF-hand superfamily protein